MPVPRSQALSRNRYRISAQAPNASPQKRPTLLSLALVLGIAGSDWQLIRMQRASAIADFSTAATNLANGFSGQTLHAFAAADPALQDVQRALPIGQTATAADIAAVLHSKAVADRLSQRLLRLPGLASLAIMDASGQLAAASVPGPPAANALTRQDLFRQLQRRDGPAVAIGAPLQDPLTGQWTSLVARRITGPQGVFAGVLLADMSLAGVEDIFRWGLPKRRQLTILRTDGTVLVRYPPQPNLTGKKVPAGSPWYAAAAGGPPYLAPDYANGTPVLTAVRPVQDLPLLSEASITQAEVLAGWRRETSWMIVAGILVSGGAVLLVHLFARQLRRLALRNAQLDEARRQLDVAISNIHQGICFFDGAQRLMVCNRRFGVMYGLAPETTRPGASMADIVTSWFAAGGPAGVSLQDFLQARETVARSGTPHHSIVELTDGRTFAIQQQPMPDGGWVATHEDITERRRAEQKISYLARHDVLTGLPNRACLMERLKMAQTAAGRGQGCAVLFLDLDRFKAVNDTMGHAAGDALLQDVSRRLRAAVRDCDMVARLGGDEFVVLQTEVQSPEAAAVLAERIIETVSLPYQIIGNEVRIGVSIGIDLALDDHNTADEILKNADMALYISKGAGRGTFRFFEPDMDANVQHRHALERDLRCALERNEFVIYYQPIIDAISGRACGVEALLRWNHPSRGLVSPDSFIAIAEESGLIIPIGEWLVREACREAATWPADIHVSVNLSPVQFRSTNLVTMVREALADARLPADQLELEITESVLLESSARNLALMHEFHASGIGVVMDDFGVGYSSLSYLLQFPFQRIKVDRCFVENLGTSRDAVSIVRAILGLCRDLKIGTIAEGVETAEQMNVLLAEGCIAMQGYLFSRPKPAAQIRAMLARARLPALEADFGVSD
jgi:diguanylate cyclase (GGDEF)-like protein